MRLCLETGVLRLAPGLKEAPFLTLLDLLYGVTAKEAQELQETNIEEETPKVVVAPDWEPGELAAMIIDAPDSQAGAELSDYPIPPMRI